MMLQKLFLAMCCISLFISCKKNDKEECVAPKLSDNIRGEWKARVKTGDLSLGPVAFNFTSDGTVEGDISEILKTYLPGTTIDEEKKYEVVDEKQVVLKLTSNGAPLTDISMDLTENTCQKIVFNLLGNTVTLTAE